MAVTALEGPPAEHTFPSRQESVLSAILERGVEDHPDRTYVAFESGGEWTYRQTLSEARRAANALTPLGLEIGDRVSVLLPASADLLRIWFGAAMIGAVYAPLNLAAKGAYLEHTLNVAGARVLVVHAQLADLLAGLHVPALERVIVVGEADVEQLPWPTVRLADLLASSSDHKPTVSRAVEPWDDAVLIYTSGTTGPSKGVRISYAALWMWNRGFIWPDIDHRDRFLQSLPMFHLSAVGPTFSMLQRGGSIALLAGFSARTFWADVRRFGATAGLVLHAMVGHLLKQPEAPDDADNPLRVAYMGPLSNVREFSQRFGVNIYTGFGMTEAGVPIRSGLNPEIESSCGRRVGQGYQLRIVDEFDVPVPAGTPGELLVRHDLPWMLNSGYMSMRFDGGARTSRRSRSKPRFSRIPPFGRWRRSRCRIRMWPPRRATRRSKPSLY
jgi:crotonobetaine/carnitine-CoA ligase